MAIDEKRLAEIRLCVDPRGVGLAWAADLRDLLAMLDEERKRADAMAMRYQIAIDMGERVLAVGDEAIREAKADAMRRAAFICDALTHGGASPTGVADALRREADLIERGDSPSPHAHPRDEPAARAHEDGLAVGDEEREVESGPRGDDVG